MSVGGPEILTILLIALLLFGPRKLPELMRSVGKAVNEFRRAATDVQRELNLMDDDERPPFV